MGRTGIKCRSYIEIVIQHLSLNDPDPGKFIFRRCYAGADGAANSTFRYVFAACLLGVQGAFVLVAN